MPFAIKIDKDEDIAGLSPIDVRKALAERNEFLFKIFEEAGEDLDPAKVKIVEIKDGRDLATQISKRNDEISKLGERVTDLDKIDSAKANNERWQAWLSGHPNDPNRFAPGNIGNRPPPSKTFGELFVASDLYTAAKERRGSVSGIIEMDPAVFLGRKSTFETTAGWAPENMRTGRVVLDEQREIEVTDIFPSIPTGQAAIVYMEETTFTSAAAERNESASYAESALALTERTQNVRSVGTSLPVTDEQLADVAGVRAYLDQRLGFMVRQRLDSQLLVGNGVAPNLTGTLNVASINTQAKGTDSVPDAIYKGMDLVRVTGRAVPNVVIVHPTDWQAVRLLTTADGIYLWGPPMDSGPARIWGLPVVLTTAVTQNTAIVGDYARFAALHMREGLEVLTGFVNNDFLQGRVTIRAGLRCAVVHYRPTAFTQVTGI